ncbi:hypothetical protein LTR62_008513 [Meristemomyces frigidus]|uniref:ATP-dependent DNA ligase family profile domain-containing protein n=1 Tax=Meristemomyces frigidus TaxID=1508187 RepID=A0AAN7THX6_9PEZI|nr:hypothetical protein LTR62_008513 [Meristemomyces frigidus]
MPFQLSSFILLLSRLEKIETRHPPLLPSDKAEALKSITQQWFKSHQRTINDLDVPGSVALLSTLLPERRTDRVYGIQAHSLCRILCRSLGLSASRARGLQAYKQPGHGDLAVCLERVLKAGGPPARPPVCLEEVDDMLQQLAVQSRFSSPAVKSDALPSSSEARDKLIGDVFKRVTAEEGKWLVRLMLKNFSPIRLHEGLVLKGFHFLLPDLLRFQSDFGAAMRMLKEDPELRQLPDHPDPRSERLFRQRAAEVLQPVVGIKVGRPEFVKARSIEHCLKMVGCRRGVLERKYDGEYCEIHIDQRISTNPLECIKIFSKSGKDSTADRQGLHETLVRCLRLGEPGCKIQEQAIFLGELVVYSDATKSVLAFDKIRKHVLRSGVFLGTNQDSQPRAHEHLAIVFFDLLLLDDQVIMHESVEERRLQLKNVYRKIPGRAMSAEWKVIDFNHTGVARSRLLEQFAASIVERCEGLVLKPCGIPYFPLHSSTDDGYTCVIKLKKDYLADMGDEADFAVIGASYNAQQAAKSGVRGIKWTDFHLGCLTNAAAVRRYDAKPAFRIVGTVQQEACIPKPILGALNQQGAYMSSAYCHADPAAPFSIDDRNTRIDVVFSTPFVVEVLGSGFDKPSDCDFYMLRHARFTKLHQDRSWKECVSFQEMQQQAADARSAPTEALGELSETRRWIAKLESKLRRRLDKEGTLTPLSKRSSPRTAPSTSGADLGGLTQVASLKRVRHGAGIGTPCPPAKRRCSAIDCTILAKPSPLTDITNQASRIHLSRRKSTTPKPHTLAPPPKALDPQLTLPRPHRANPCSSTKCLFNSAALFLPPCLRNRPPYITQTLLSRHSSTLLTNNLQYWDREAFSHPPGAAVVAESQAYGGMRKIVLVDARDTERVGDVVREILALGGGGGGAGDGGGNKGALRERIEVYDWRVLESCVKHDRQAENLKEFLVGATMFHEHDEGKGRAVFVSAMGIPGHGHVV